MDDSVVHKVGANAVWIVSTCRQLLYLTLYCCLATNYCDVVSGGQML